MPSYSSSNASRSFVVANTLASPLRLTEQLLLLLLFLSPAHLHSQLAVKHIGRGDSAVLLGELV